jgi:hypothetical protein
MVYLYGFIHLYVRYTCVVITSKCQVIKQYICSLQECDILLDLAQSKTPHPKQKNGSLTKPRSM